MGQLTATKVKTVNVGGLETSANYKEEEYAADIPHSTRFAQISAGSRTFSCSKAKPFVCQELKLQLGRLTSNKINIILSISVLAQQGLETSELH